MVKFTQGEMNIIAVVLFTLFAIVSSAPQADKNPAQEECKKKMNVFFKKSHKAFMACHADTKAQATEQNEPFDKIGCTVKCVLKKDNLLDDTEKISDELISKIYKGLVNPEYEEKLGAKFMDCKNKFGEAVDDKDEQCKVFGQYGLCIQEAMSHVCYE